VAPTWRTSGSSLKKPIQSDGTTALSSPTLPVMVAASPAPVSATLRARAACPAPTFMPTIVTSAVPIPKISGIWRYSSRAPAP
jgi:hypothetical protein